MQMQKQNSFTILLNICENRQKFYFLINRKMVYILLVYG